MKKDQMCIYQLKQLIKWCELGYSNETFWQRWVLVSTVYDERTRSAMLALEQLANKQH